MKHKALLIALLSLVLLSCGDTKKKEDKKSAPPKMTIEPVKDLYKFKHILNSKGEYFNIEITGVDTKIEKKAFKTKASEFAIEKVEDGVLFVLSFSITNPTSQEMQIPFPEVFKITASEFDGLPNYFFNKSCWCHESSSVDITTKKGKELSKIGKWANNEHQVVFKPNETKEMKVTFTTPFTKKTHRLTFIGFNRYIRAERDYFSMDDAERKAYNEDVDKQYGFSVDLNTKKLTGFKEYKR